MQRRDFLVLASLLITGCATKPAAKPEVAGMLFSETDRKTIIRFYSQGIDRKRSDPIPAQQIKPGDLLDTGLRPNKLPTELDKLLPYLPAPYTRLTLGADVILVNRDTHAVLDVIPQLAY